MLPKAFPVESLSVATPLVDDPLLFLEILGLVVIAFGAIAVGLHHVRTLARRPSPETAFDGNEKTITRPSVPRFVDDLRSQPTSPPRPPPSRRRPGIVLPPIPIVAAASPAHVPRYNFDDGPTDVTEVTATPPDRRSLPSRPAPARDLEPA